MKNNNKDTIIRSTKCSLKFSNTNKKNTIDSFINEYQKTTQFFIDTLWDTYVTHHTKHKIPTLLPKNITQQARTWISQRSIQCSAKQASSIVRGTIKKHKQRIYVLRRLQKQGKNTKKLQRAISKTILTKPELSHINPELDSRFIEVMNSDNSFNLWIKFSSLGRKLKFYVPIKKTKHFNRLIDNGFAIKSGLRLSKDKVTFNLEKSRPEPTQNQTETIGIDIGILNSWTASNNTSSQKCPHGHSLDSIQKKLSRKKKGSNNFQKVQTHRTNYINWSINQLNLHNVRRVRIERLKDIRRYKKQCRYMSHWDYPDITNKLERFCQDQGVLVEKVNPTYSSQRCSQCGWTRKSNRKRKTFCCSQCDFTCDSDLNASLNIRLDLPAISREERLKKKNRKGFYWFSVQSSGHEPIVHDVQKA